MWVVGPVAMFGCVYLFFSLGRFTQFVFLGWTIVGLVLYSLYGRSRSQLARESV